MDASDHAASWWLYDRCCPVQIQHRKSAGYLRIEQSWYATTECSARQHVCLHVRQYVDQQRSITCALLLNHPADSAKLAQRFGYDQSAASGYCTIGEYWRCRFPNSFTTESHCVAKHGARAFLGRMVFHIASSLYPLDSIDLGFTSPHLPAWTRDDNRSNPADERQVYRNTMVHHYSHYCYHPSLVLLASIGIGLRRHGRDSHPAASAFLRNWYSHQGRLQQFPVDYYHPGCGRPCTG